MPCGDAGRERHTRSYLLIATNKQPFVPWRGTGREVSPMTSWSHQHPPLPTLPRSMAKPYRPGQTEPTLWQLQGKPARPERQRDRLRSTSGRDKFPRLSPFQKTEIL